MKSFVCQLHLITKVSVTVLQTDSDTEEKIQLKTTGLFPPLDFYSHFSPSSQRQYHKYFTLNACTAEMHSKAFSTNTACSATQLCLKAIQVINFKSFLSCFQRKSNHKKSNRLLRNSKIHLLIFKTVMQYIKKFGNNKMLHSN